jgi:hypothetical protein
LGTTENVIDILNISAIGAAKNGAPFFKIQAESASSPVAVGRNASSILNTLHSVMSLEVLPEFVELCNQSQLRYSRSAHSIISCDS